MLDNDSILSIFEQINRLEIPVSESEKTPVEYSDSMLFEVLIEIAEEIQRLMDDNDLTQEDLCRLANMSQSSLSKIQNCKAVPKLETLQKIAVATHTRLVISFESTEEDYF